MLRHMLILRAIAAAAADALMPMPPRQRADAAAFAFIRYFMLIFRRAAFHAMLSPPLLIMLFFAMP